MSARFESADTTARLRALFRKLAHLIRVVVNEIQYLNNARMDRGVLSAMTRRERRAVVKAALSDHHRHPNRCC
jgi:hypothetical protein